MKKGVLRRDTDLARIDFYIFDVLLVDFVAVLRQHDTTPIVKSLNVCTGDRDVDAPNHDVTLLLGVDYGFVHAFHGRLEIDNLALAHATRWRLSHSEDFRCAVRPALADHHANLRSANFQTDH